MRARGTAFTTLLTLAAAALLVQTLSLAPGSRLAPLWVIIPTLSLLALKLALDAASLLDRESQTAREAHRFDTPTDAGVSLHRHGPQAQTHDRRQRQLRMAFWMAYLLALVYVLGFLISLPLYLVPYLRIETRFSWSKTLLIAALTTALLYLIFSVLLKVPFPSGLIA